MTSFASQCKKHNLVLGKREAIDLDREIESSDESFKELSRGIRSLSRGLGLPKRGERHRDSRCAIRLLLSRTGSGLTPATLVINETSGGDVVSRIKVCVIALSGGKRTQAVVLGIAPDRSRSVIRLTGRSPRIHRHAPQPVFDGFRVDPIDQHAMEPPVETRFHRAAFTPCGRPPAFQLLNHNRLAVVFQRQIDQLPANLVRFVIRQLF